MVFKKGYISYKNLYNLYINKKLSSIEIAKHFNVDKGTILYWLKKNNVKRRTLSEAHSLLIGLKSPFYKNKIKKECEYCKREFYVCPCNKRIRFCSKDCWHKNGYSKESKDKMRKSQNKILSNPIKKREYLRRILDKYQMKPNLSEQRLHNLLNKLFPNEWIFSGDFEIEMGGKSPDFYNINSKKKKVIELFGDYWHKGEDINNKIIHYERFDHECLVIWEHELKNEIELTKKLQEFNLNKKEGIISE